MTHNERVENFLKARNLTIETAFALPVEERAALDAQFRAEKRAEQMARIEGSTKISRPTLRKFFTIGQEITLVYAAGSDCEKKRTVLEHKSYGYEMQTPDGRKSSLRHETGETILLLPGRAANGAITPDIITILDKDGIFVVQYTIEHEEAVR